MNTLRISLACGSYDRTCALFDGRAPIEGCEVAAVALEPEEAFHRAFRYREFDVTEISMSSHMMTTARGDNDYVAIPAFISRVFRQSGIYVRTDRALPRPRTCAAGSSACRSTRSRPMSGSGASCRTSMASVPRRSAGAGAASRNRGAASARPSTWGLESTCGRFPTTRRCRACWSRGDRRLYRRARAILLLRARPTGRLYGDDYIEAEKAYFRRSGIFPIMHMVGIRKSLAAAHPWLPVSVYKAFIKAKELAVRDLGEICHLAATLPWMAHHLDEARALMGQDFWPYGLEANRHAIDTFSRHHFEQGSSKRRVAPEELFAPSALDLSKI